MAQLEEFSAIARLNVFNAAGMHASHHHAISSRTRQRFILHAGVDKETRPVVVFSMSHLPSRDQIDMDKLIRCAVCIAV